MKYSYNLNDEENDEANDNSEILPAKSYVVCFESNSINEIEGVLNVKDFQMKYVINHHVVCYDHWLLKQAAEEMAYYYYPKAQTPTEALEKIISVDSVIGRKKIPNTKLVIENIADDDLFFLMKQRNNDYYKQLSSRQYSYGALWKSPDEFYQHFKINREKYHQNARFRTFVTNSLASFMDEKDIVVIDADIKPRVVMDSIFISVNNDVVKYTDLYPHAKNRNINQKFSYVFVKKNDAEDYEDWEAKKDRCIRLLYASIHASQLDNN